MKETIMPVVKVAVVVRETKDENPDLRKR